jgi:hypothetical protein
MENQPIIYNIKIDGKTPCPKCKKGELVPFLKEIMKGVSSELYPDYGYGRDRELDHYEIVYRCSNCNNTLERKTVIP